MLSRLFLILIPVTMMAQSPTPSTSAFFGVYGSFEPQSSPKPSAGIFGATSVKGIWGVGGYDLTWSKHNGLTNTAFVAPVLSALTSLGTQIFVIAAPGLSLGASASSAPTPSTSASLSFVGGVMAEVPRPKNSKWWDSIIPLLVGTTITKGANVDALEIKFVWGRMIQ
jgi:hypothetical protein